MRFYLKQEIGSNREIYYVCWTDDANRGRRESTGTTDFEQAQIILSRKILEADKPRDLRHEAVTLVYILLKYAESSHGKTRFAQLPIKYAFKDTLRFLPETTIAGFDTALQRRYIATLQHLGDKEDWLPGAYEKPQSAATITRRLAVLLAALNQAAKEKLIGPGSFEIEMPEKTHSRGTKRFSLKEMQALFEAARTYTERVMLVVWTTTLCRPGQILDLTCDRVDFEEHSIDFRVPNRRETKKGRAKVLMCPTAYAFLKPLLEGREGLVVFNQYTGAALTDYDNHMTRLCRRSGVKGSAYRIRKYSGSYLANKGISEAQIQHMLAHKFASGETSRYIEADLPPIILALEQMMREIDCSWLPKHASSVRVAKANPLFGMVAANDSMPA